MRTPTRLSGLAVAAIASFVLAALMALLVGFGLWHARRVPEDTEILGTGTAPNAKTPVTV